MQVQFQQYPDNLDPYAMNLIITDNTHGNAYRYVCKYNFSLKHYFSIAKLAQQRDGQQRKTPLTISVCCP